MCKLTIISCIKKRYLSYMLDTLSVGVKIYGHPKTLDT